MKINIKNQHSKLFKDIARGEMFIRVNDGELYLCIDEYTDNNCRPVNAYTVGDIQMTGTHGTYVHDTEPVIPIKSISVE